MTEYALYDRVRHKRTDGFYMIERFIKMRVGDEWIAGVLYCALDDRNQVYARPLDNFIEAFELATERRVNPR